MKLSINDTRVILLRDFLTLSRCPPAWRHYDLYLFLNEDDVFYVGQSYCAFDRVWEHLRGGYKGQSVVGLFVVCNWPRSIRFTVQLLCSRAGQFDCVHYDLNAAERYLIEQFSPCFNDVLNRTPRPLPEEYAPPTADGRRIRSLRRMIREATYAGRLESWRTAWTSKRSGR
jgi:hypothetical protein